MMVLEPVDQAASALLQARRARRWLPSLPEACRPRSLRDSYAIQGKVLAELGPIAAWKVGAPRPDAEPACAAIATATTFESGTVIPAAMFHMLGIEAEIAYRLSSDLPPRDRDYEPDELIAAIGSIHPVIEISDTRFVEWASQDRFSHVADQLNHGALIVGEGRSDWCDVAVTSQETILSINGETSAAVVGGNPAGDPLRLLLWLANVGARPFGGLRAGTVVTTGSVTGVAFVTAPAKVAARLPGIGSVTATIGEDR
ncbi:2-keto-4-pentenoate hydratase [Labrys wisconsinensis]|uniref:2-keto-4-pentenoate hydratase n=1 Tax=Labrys wisconsinensis TaxID=425677 RepID=A0ABU0JCD2_9HYPH|nr:fumarylacetoacetate hydrolase family protein [Labrys wisconsinensis]MDQ0471942.1 2-keto-4-pentenoate hydratase [Labrys wisconsinensis]